MYCTVLCIGSVCCELKYRSVVPSIGCRVVSLIYLSSHCTAVPQALYAAPGPNVNPSLRGLLRTRTVPIIHVCCSFMFRGQHLSWKGRMKHRIVDFYAIGPSIIFGVLIIKPCISFQHKCTVCKEHFFVLLLKHPAPGDTSTNVRFSPTAVP